MGIKCDVKGEQSQNAALYVSNHRSLSDPLVSLAYLDAYVIAKAEVGQIPVLAQGAKLTGILYVKRENKDSRSAVRQMMIDTLQNGFNVLVYPEGTVNTDKQIMKYKHGTFNEAAKHGIPVVPIAVEYRDKKDLWFNRSMMQHFFHQFGRLRTHCKMVIGPEFSNSDGDVLREQVEDWTMKTIQSIHNNWDSYFSKHSTHSGQIS